MLKARLSFREHEIIERISQTLGYTPCQIMAVIVQYGGQKKKGMPDHHREIIHLYRRGLGLIEYE